MFTLQSVPPCPPTFFEREKRTFLNVCTFHTQSLRDPASCSVFIFLKGALRAAGDESGVVAGAGRADLLPAAGGGPPLPEGQLREEMNEGASWEDTRFPGWGSPLRT